LIWDIDTELVFWGYTYMSQDGATPPPEQTAAASFPCGVKFEKPGNLKKVLVSLGEKRKYRLKIEEKGLTHIRRISIQN